MCVLLCTCKGSFLIQRHYLSVSFRGCLQCAADLGPAVENLHPAVIPRSPPRLTLLGSLRILLRWPDGGPRRLVSGATWRTARSRRVSLKSFLRYYKRRQPPGGLCLTTKATSCEWRTTAKTITCR